MEPHGTEFDEAELMRFCGIGEDAFIDVQRRIYVFGCRDVHTKYLLVIEGK